MKDKEKTRVVFRTYSNGEVIALFPQIPADVFGTFCLSYMHVDQHGAANTDVVVFQTGCTIKTGYDVLQKELEQLGYNLEIGQVCTAKDREIRREKANELWRTIL